MNAMSPGIQPQGSFADLRAQYEAARAAEQAHDAIAFGGASSDYVSAEAEAENDRLTDIRSVIEDRLMAMPSPDAAAFAFKYLVAHGGGRDADYWDAALEEEAKRFAAVADPHMGWLRERDGWLRKVNTTRGISDADAEDWTDKGTSIEDRIFMVRPRSMEGILAQALLIIGRVTLTSGGDKLTAEMAQRVFANAQALGLIEYEA